MITEPRTCATLSVRRCKEGWRHVPAKVRRRDRQSDTDKVFLRRVSWSSRRLLPLYDSCRNYVRLDGWRTGPKETKRRAQETETGKL